MPRQLRCAVIGTGAIGCDHLKSILLCPRARTVAIAEIHKGRAASAADSFRVPRVYSDYRDLLKQPDIDAVTVALPNYLHAPVAIAALKAGKHVFLEKPMALNAPQAAAIADASRKARRVLMVGMNLRFHRETQTARRIIQRGELGELYHARCFWLRWSGIPRIGSWFTQRKFAGGGCALDIGVHLLDTALHLFGDFDVARVSAKTHSRLGPRGLGNGTWGKGDIDPRLPFDVEDYCLATIELRSGKTVQFEISWAGFHVPDGREYGVDVLGTAGGVSLFPARFCRNNGKGFEIVLPRTEKLAAPEDRIHHFINCALDGKKPLVPPAESIQVQRALDAIYRSARTGSEVKLKKT